MFFDSFLNPLTPEAARGDNTSGVEMNAEEILNLLVDEFGSDTITGSNLEAIDP